MQWAVQSLSLIHIFMMGSDLPQANGGATENTVKSAAIIIAILPFMILYPFLQDVYKRQSYMC